MGEFFTSEPGEMSAHRSAQIGAVFGAAAAVGAMMAVAQPAAANGVACGAGGAAPFCDPNGREPWCVGLWCGTACQWRCTGGDVQCLP